MPFDDKKIAAFREECRKLNKNDTIKKISNLDDRVDVVSSICAIIGDIEKSQTKKSNQDLSVFKTYFCDAKAKMNANFIEKTKILGKLTHEGMTKELTTLVDKSTTMSIEIEQQALWKELILFLQGLAEYKPSAIEDTALFNQTKLKTADIVAYYLKIITNLEGRIKELENKPVEKTTSKKTSVRPTKAKPVKDQEDKKEEEKDETDDQDNNTEETISINIEKDAEGIDTIVIKMPHDKDFFPKLNYLLHHYKEKDIFKNRKEDKEEYKAENEVGEAKSLTEYLLMRTTSDPVDKIRCLRSGLHKFPLTTAEKEIIEDQMGEMVGHIKKYANKSRYFVFPAQHQALAKFTVQSIQNESCVKKKMELFFKLFEETIGLDSKTLNPDTIDACTVAYDRLVQEGNLTRRISMAG